MAITLIRFEFLHEIRRNAKFIEINLIYSLREFQFKMKGNSGPILIDFFIPVYAYDS